MRFCKDHWQMCRDAVSERGMDALVARDGHEAIERAVGELNGEDTKKTFDPLMSLNWHFTNGALKYGGLYLMGQNETGENEGHYCPVCEFAKHYATFIPKHEIGKVADHMRDWCRSEGLIAKLS
jgi:hypothetical protein